MPPELNRRDLLAAAVAMSAGLPAAASRLPANDDAPVAQGPADLAIIDCHTHFYDPARPEGVPWPDDKSSLYRTVLPADLRALPMFRPVTGTVIVEASPWAEDNQWLLDLAKDEPFIVGIVGNLLPGSPEFAAQVRRFVANPLFRGIRINVALLRTLVEAEDFADLRLLAECDLALDVNGGPETPAVVARAAQKLPDLRFVQNHIGNVAITSAVPPADWQAGIVAAAAQPNVYCKISALVEGAARDGRKAPPDLEFYRPYIDVVWNAFGDDRVIYGSNWPVSELAADYATLQRLSLTYAFERGEAATRNFCSTNAARAYKYLKR